jgi:hypothetical protein
MRSRVGDAWSSSRWRLGSEGAMLGWGVSAVRHGEASMPFIGPGKERSGRDVKGEWWPVVELY